MKKKVCFVLIAVAALTGCQQQVAEKERFSDILTSTPSIGSYRENSLKKNLVGEMVWFAIYETAKERYGSQMSLPLYEKMCRASIAMPMMLRMARMTKPGSEAEQRWQDEHPDGTFISK